MAPRFHQCRSVDDDPGTTEESGRKTKDNVAAFFAKYDALRKSGRTGCSWRLPTRITTISYSIIIMNFSTTGERAISSGMSVAFENYRRID